MSLTIVFGNCTAKTINDLDPGLNLPEIVFGEFFPPFVGHLLKQTRERTT